MQFTYLAIALFAAATLGAPVAAPSESPEPPAPSDIFDIFDTPASISDDEPGNFTFSPKKPIPMSNCCVTWHGFGCGPKLCG